MQEYSEVALLSAGPVVRRAHTGVVVMAAVQKSTAMDTLLVVQADR